MDNVTCIGRPTAHATSNGLPVLSLPLLILTALAALAGRPAWPVTQAPEAQAVSPGAPTAPPSVCDTPIPIADAPDAGPASLRCIQDPDGTTRLQLVILD